MPKTIKRRPLRIQKSYDTYEIKTGDAGFVQLIKNGKRVTPKNFSITFTRRANIEKRLG